MLIEDSNDGVLGIRQADGQVIRYEKDNDGNYHSNTSALEILKKTETGYVLENIGKERKLFKSDSIEYSGKAYGNIGAAPGKKYVH